MLQVTSMRYVYVYIYIYVCVLPTHSKHVLSSFSSRAQKELNWSDIDSTLGILQILLYSVNLSLSPCLIVAFSPLSPPPSSLPYSFAHIIFLSTPSLFCFISSPFLHVSLPLFFRKYLSSLLVHDLFQFFFHFSLPKHLFHLGPLGPHFVPSFFQRLKLKVRRIRRVEAKDDDGERKKDNKWQRGEKWCALGITKENYGNCAHATIIKTIIHRY